MLLQKIEKKLITKNIPLLKGNILNLPTVIAYEKKFKFRWFATQMNTFIVATDFGDETITPQVIEKHLSESYSYAKNNYTGWPKGLQSGLSVIALLISNQVTEEAANYCLKSKSGKKWAAMTVPVICNPKTEKSYYFETNPVWGMIYYPYFKRTIQEII